VAKPKASRLPIVILCLGKQAAARALGIKVERINDALDAGILEARQVGKQIKIPVWGPKGMTALYESWPLAKRRACR
jgi:GMP synthase-like glutamine amidotransferase